MSSVESPQYPLTLESQYAAYDIWDYLRVESKPSLSDQADAIMVLGCSTNQVAYTAAHLFHQGLAPWVICTGGNSRKSAGWPVTEAGVNRATLLDLKVPQDQILADHKAKNFGENIQNSRILLLQKIDRPKRVIGVPIDFAARRWQASMERQWVGVEALVVPAGTDYHRYFDNQERFNNFAHNLVLELGKIITYPSQDFMKNQDWNDPDFVQARVARARLLELRIDLAATKHL